MSVNGRLAGKTAIITGAANGMGLAHAQACLREGATVVMTDIEPSSVAEAAQRLSGAGFSVVGLRHDVSNEADWRHVVQYAVQTFGGLDILVNNAGAHVTGSIEECTIEDWRRMANVNAKGVFLGCKTAQDPMKQRGGGSIINIVSGLGSVGAPGCAAYCASKGAAATFTRAVMADLAPHNIRVNAIMPGVVNTRMAAFFLDADEATRRAGLGPTLLERPAEPQEISEAVVFLASDAASYVNGVEWMIDGGWSAV